MSGPAAKPTKLKILEGNAGKRPLPKSEPSPVVAANVPRCPAYLKGEARREWERIVPELHRLGLLTTIDRAAIEVYCSYYQQWKEAEDELARLRRKHRDALKRRKRDPLVNIKGSNGMIFVTKSNNAIMEPVLSVKKQAAEMMHKFLVEFGMTPASRTRITTAAGGTGKKKATSPLERMLDGKAAELEISN